MDLPYVSYRTIICYTVIPPLKSLFKYNFQRYLYSQTLSYTHTHLNLEQFRALHQEALSCGGGKLESNSQPSGCQTTTFSLDQHLSPLCKGAFMTSGQTIVLQWPLTKHCKWHKIGSKRFFKFEYYSALRLHFNFNINENVS